MAPEFSFSEEQESREGGGQFRNFKDCCHGLTVNKTVFK